uniref:G protein-coupled receptor n=1 Tax=Bursaphelenchus xylophilus TaxID=6326 RepID=A0A1I7SUX3_BURXY
MTRISTPPSFRLDHINKCVKGEIDEEQCLNATKPEVLLHKIFKLINTRYEKDNNIEKFEECAAKIHESVPWEYVRVMHRHNQYSTGRNKHRCISIDQICRDNSKYLIPFACFVKKNCDRSIADLGYAMQYAFQQISLEQEGPIRVAVKTYQAVYANLGDMPPYALKGFNPSFSENEEPVTRTLWTAASMTCLILAFNRLCDLINPRLMILLFHGNRTYYWFIGPILYFFYFFFFTYPFVYTSANYAGFSNPYVGTVFEAQTNLQYFNLSLILHNIMVPVLMVLMYTIISAVVVVKSYRAKSATARLNSPALTKYQKSTIMQAFLICSVFIIAPIIYDWMNYYGAPWLMVVIGQVCWQSCHGIAVFIYISFNRALREKMMTFIQKPKVHTTSSGQHDDVFNRV